MTKNDIKKILDERGVAYPKSADLGALEKILKANPAEETDASTETEETDASTETEETEETDASEEEEEDAKPTVPKTPAISARPSTLARQIIFGTTPDGKVSLILIAATPAEVKELRNIQTKALTEGEYKGFSFLEIWNRGNGHSRTIPLGRGKARKALLEREAAKRAEAAEKAKEDQAEASDD